MELAGMEPWASRVRQLWSEPAMEPGDGNVGARNVVVGNRNAIMVIQMWSWWQRSMGTRMWIQDRDGSVGTDVAMGTKMGP